MPRNYFTDEQIEELKKCPYVLKVSKANVTFTDEFKYQYLNLLNSGFSPINSFKELGVNYKILGRNRVNSLVKRIRKFSKRPEGFSRKVNSSKGKPRKKRVPTFENESEAAEYYKEYSLKLEQEITLLKKVRALEEKQSSSRAKNLR